jgi:pilus assembly protein CpaB
MVLRRLLAASCAAGAVAGVLAVARAPQHAETKPVVVAGRAIAVGQVVDAASVRVARWPAPLVPDGALESLSAVVGRPAGTPIGAGEPLTAARLSASALLAGQPTGTVAVHISLVDAASASMLDEGGRVDLLGPHGPVARDVVVLRVDRSPNDGVGSGRGLGGDLSAGPDGPGAGMVVGADEQTAAALAAAPLDALGRPALTVVLRSQ